jgi:hypothetical protein
MDNHLQAPAHGTNWITQWIGPRTPMDTVMIKRKLRTFKGVRTYVQVPYSPQSTTPKASFPFNMTPISALNPVQTPVLWIRGWVSLEKERSKRETEHSAPSNVEIKDACSFTSTFPYVTMA